MERRAIALTDIVDSTAWVRRLGDEHAAALWLEHDRSSRRLLALHRGREIDRSDGYLLVFERVIDAATFAIAYHELLTSLGAAARVGIHWAQVSLRPNPPEEIARGAKPFELEGLGKSVAARIMALSSGGRTLLSGDAAASLEASAFAGWLIRSHGYYRIKGVEEPIEVAELAPESTAAAPPADTEKAYRVVRSAEVWLPAREIRHNLEPDRDAFIGRAAELRELAQRLEDGARLITVLGPPGMGKTRLARRYAQAWLGDWPGGAHFCDLSKARTLDGIQFAVASGLGVPLSGADPATQLGHAIAACGRCLLLLDNFEQVQAYADETVGRWLDRAPEARFVVTSRERLRLRGEDVFELEPLDVEAALELFETRVRAHQPTFSVDAENVAVVEQIARLLDGLPLALELAAARVRVLSPAQIVARLRDRFALLARGSGAAGRQATLRAAIDWSWELLAPHEQRTLAQCAVFDGPFTLEAAEAAVELSAWPDAPPALDVIESLVDKSLLRVQHRRSAANGGGTEPLFGMYLSIHEYAEAKLDSFGGDARREAERRHGRYFARFGSDEAQRSLITHGGVARRRLLALQLDNLLSACRRAIDDADPERAAQCFLGAWMVLEARGPFRMCADLGERVSSLSGLTPHFCALVELATAHALRLTGRGEVGDEFQARALARARMTGDRRIESMALGHMAMWRYRRGENEEAHHLFDAALALQAELDDPPRRAVILANLANLLKDEGRVAEARASYQAALDLHRKVGNRAAEGIALGNLGTLQHDLGHLDEARGSYAGALVIHREVGSLIQEAITLWNIGILAYDERNFDRAEEHYRAALDLQRQVGDRGGEGMVLAQLAELFETRGEAEAAREHFERALSIHRELGNAHFEGTALAFLGLLDVQRGKVAAGEEALRDGERILRRVGDSINLAKVLCLRGSAALHVGNREAADAALDEAASIAAQLGALPASSVVARIEQLRSELGRSSA